jgi:hypothetical protein
MDRAERGGMKALDGSVAPPGTARALAARAFRRHLFSFVLGNCVLTAINVYTGAPWWSFWPLIAWGLLLMIHYLFFRAATVEDAWVEERILDLRAKSYDLGHIDVIRDNPAPSIRQDER